MVWKNGGKMSLYQMKGNRDEEGTNKEEIRLSDCTYENKDSANDI